MHMKATWSQNRKSPGTNHWLRKRGTGFFLNEIFGITAAQKYTHAFVEKERVI